MTSARSTLPASPPAGARVDRTARGISVLLPPPTLRQVPHFQQVSLAVTVASLLSLVLAPSPWRYLGLALVVLIVGGLTVRIPGVDSVEVKCAGSREALDYTAAILTRALAGSPVAPA